MSQPDFIHVYVVRVMQEIGLNEAQQTQYLPLLRPQIEERIGLLLAPKLPPERLNEMMELAEKKDASTDVWRTFWYDAIPNFEAEFEQVMQTLTKEIQQMLAT